MTDAIHQQCQAETKRRLWTGPNGEKLSLIEPDGLALEVGHTVVVLTARRWHELAMRDFSNRAALASMPGHDKLFPITPPDESA